MTLRTAFAALAALGLANLPARAQQADTEARIGEIRTWYAEVQNALDSLRLLEREYAIGGGGGQLSLYRSGEEPRKLVVRFDGDGLSWTREYFFRGGAVFFVLELGETFPIWPDQPPENFGATEHRFYVADGHMIRWVTGSHREDMRQREVSPRDDRWGGMETALLEDAENWLAFAVSDHTDFDTFLERRR